MAIQFPEPDNSVFAALETTCVSTLQLRRKRTKLALPFPVVLEGDFIHFPFDREAEVANALSFTPA